ncbi:MAG: dehydrogenase [Geminicoccaceae bacterium]
MTTARAYWSTAPFEGEIREQELPPPGEGEVRVETLFSALSQGTEKLVAAGLVPDSEHRRMRCPFQEGDFPFPVKYGYCNVGRVTEGPSELVGRTVFSLYPHQDRFNIPAAMVTVLPDDLPPRRAVLTANMETALNAIWDSRITAGDRVQVVGAGVIGLLTASLAARFPGTEARIHDIDAGRMAAAAALGLECGIVEDADIVFHCSGSEAGLVRSLELAGFEGTIVEMSWHGARTIGLPLGAAFHSRRLKLVSSQVGHIPLHQTAKWTHARRIANAAKLLRDTPIDVTHFSDCLLDDLPQMVKILSGKDLSFIGSIVRYA